MLVDVVLVVLVVDVVEVDVVEEVVVVEVDVVVEENGKLIGFEVEVKNQKVIINH